MNQKELNQEIKDRSNQIQKECHSYIDAVVDSMNPEERKKAEYQDMTNAWLFLKLAQLEMKIEKLNKK